MAEITISMVRRIRTLSTLSEAAWDQAIEDTDGTRVEAVATSANRCSDEYEAAVDALLGDDIDTARLHLEAARLLEAEGGDDKHARAALAVLD